jgi:hypothetical protein
VAGAALIRKIASLLLLLCFVLPLTKCSVKEEPIVEPRPGAAPAAHDAPILTAPVPPRDTYFYGYDLVIGNIIDLRNGKPEKIFYVAIELLAFFFPFATMWMREPRRSGAQLLAAFPSLYFLIHMTFLGTPQIGGVLALACWACLLAFSTATLWIAFRRRRRN